MTRINQGEKKRADPAAPAGWGRVHFLRTWLRKDAVWQQSSGQRVAGMGKAEGLIREWGLAKGARRGSGLFPNSSSLHPWLTLRILEKSGGGIDIHLPAPLLASGPRVNGLSISTGARSSGG